jgi:O-antigen ligase
VVVGLLGLVVAVAQGVPWVNYLSEIKGFYLWILIAVVCVNVVRTRLTLQLVMAVAIVSAIPNVIFQLRDSVAGNAMVQATVNGTVINRTSGGSGAINQYACYIMIIFFISLGLGMAARRWAARLFFFGCAAYFLLGIGLTYTRGAYIATLAGLAVLAIAGGWRMRAGLVAASIAAYLLVPPLIWARLNFNDNSTAERVDYLRTATAAIQSYPWLGGGWGSNFVLVANHAVPANSAGDLPFWHDDYLIVATQVGLPGLVVFLWIWVALIWVCVLAYRRAPPGPSRTYLLALLAAAIAFFVQASTEMLFWNIETGPVLWLVAGLLCAVINMQREEQKMAPPPMVVGRTQ